MTPKIVVIGGSGLIGSKVVEKLKQKGNDAVAAPPGEGSDETLAGAEVVVDVADSPFFQDQAAWEFFQIVGENLAIAEVADAINFLYTAYENLAAAEVAARVKHHIALSVVGTERLQDSAYFRAKLIQETLIKGSPIPYTIIRATQVFEFIRAIAHFSTEGDTVRVSHSLFQPLAAEDVASGVAETALEAPRNGTVDIAGPDEFYIDELVAKVLEYDKDPRNVTIDDPGGCTTASRLMTNP
jgi:uncharacterized protein YbjT (DUF2867 family)